MSNEYPPPSTLMNQSPINGNIVASVVYDYYINNKLHKAIDEYWQSKYKTFATGRIKRMRSRRKSRYVDLKKRLGKVVFSFNFSWIDFYYPIKRWTRH